MRFTSLLIPLLIPLVLLPAACSRSGTWTYHNDGYTTFSSHSDGSATHIQIGQGDNERKIRVIGEVDLGEDGSDIRLLTPGASFGIKENGWDGKRQLDVRRAADGASVYAYQFEGAEHEYDAEAREWIAGVVHDLHRKTSIGARSRAARLLAEGGVDRVLGAIEEIDSSSAIRIYVGTLLGDPTLSPEQLITTVDVAGRKVSSSSSLEEILVEVADQHRADEALTLKVVEAASRISSSSSHGEVLGAVARSRPMTAASSGAFYRSAAAISSSSTKEELLVEAIGYAPQDDASMGAYFDAADSISSSSSHGAVLEAAWRSGNLSSVARLRWIRSVGQISSTSTREGLLVLLFQTPMEDAAALTAALGEVRRLSSSSSQEACLRACLSRQGLDKTILKEAEKTIDTISSSSTRDELRDLLLEMVLG